MINCFLTSRLTASSNLSNILSSQALSKANSTESSISACNEVGLREILPSGKYSEPDEAEKPAEEEDKKTLDEAEAEFADDPDASDEIKSSELSVS